MTVWATRPDQVDLRGPNPHDLARSRLSPSAAEQCRPRRRQPSRPAEGAVADQPTAQAGERTVVCCGATMGCSIVTTGPGTAGSVSDRVTVRVCPGSSVRYVEKTGCPRSVSDCKLAGAPSRVARVKPAPAVPKYDSHSLVWPRGKGCAGLSARVTT